MFLSLPFSGVIRWTGRTQGSPLHWKEEVCKSVHDKNRYCVGATFLPRLGCCWYSGHGGFHPPPAPPIKGGELNLFHPERVDRLEGVGWQEFVGIPLAGIHGPKQDTRKGHYKIFLRKRTDFCRIAPFISSPWAALAEKPLFWTLAGIISLISMTVTR